MVNTPAWVASSSRKAVEHSSTTHFLVSPPEDVAASSADELTRGPGGLEAAGLGEPPAEPTDGEQRWEAEDVHPLPADPSRLEDPAVHERAGTEAEGELHGEVPEPEPAHPGRVAPRPPG